MTARVALRLAGRNARRSRARTSLILVMIAIPVTLLSLAVTLLAQIPGPGPAVDVPLGRADAVLWGGPGWDDIEQDPTGSIEYSPHGKPFTAAQVVVLAGPGTRAVSYVGGRLRYLTPYGYQDGGAAETDLRDPIVRDVFRLESGRLPERAGEAVATQAARGEGIAVGTTIYDVAGRNAVRVVGLGRYTDSGVQPGLVAFPGSLPGLDLVGDTEKWLLDTPGPILLGRVHELNAGGAIVVSRALLGDTSDRRPAAAELLPVLAPWVGLLFLQVALAAGPAFAVGTRRRARQFALLAAQGAAPRQLWQIALAEGLLLGALGSVMGTVVGVAAAAVLREPFGGWLFDLTPSFVMPWAYILPVVVIGTVGGLLAALASAARAARTDPAQVLTGQRAAIRHRRGWTIAGVILTLAGSASMIVASRVDITPTVTAALLTLFGLIALVPAVLSAAARAGGWLPLPLRFAVRDAARNRTRSTPAVAAVMMAVAVLMAVGVIWKTSLGDVDLNLNRQPQGPPGALVVHGDLSPELWGRVRQEVKRTLPAAVPLVEAGGAATKDGLPLIAGHVPVNGVFSDGGVDPGGRGGLLVGDERLLRYVLGRDDPEAAAALRAGKAVVLDQTMIRGGKLVLDLDVRGGSEHPIDLKLPALSAHATGAGWARAVVSPETLARQGLTTGTVLLLVDPADYRVPDATAGLVARRLAGITPQATVAWPKDPGDRVVVLVLGLVAAVLVLSMTFVATALAVVEARPDFAVMSAVGAAPRTKRAVAGAQAFTVALLGSALGAAAGAVLGAAIMVTVLAARTYIAADGTRTKVPAAPIEVPWNLVALLVAGLPLVAALVVAAVSRSRLPLPARAAG